MIEDKKNNRENERQKGEDGVENPASRTVDVPVIKEEKNAEYQRGKQNEGIDELIEMKKVEKNTDDSRKNGDWKDHQKEKRLGHLRFAFDIARLRVSKMLSDKLNNRPGKRKHKNENHRFFCFT
mgnify:CR=1 FL=1